MKEFLELLLTFRKEVEGTPFEWVAPIIVIVVAVGVVILLLKVFISDVLIPCGKLLKKLYDRASQRFFIKNKMYQHLSIEPSSDVYDAINRYIPTRYSMKRDPGNEEEPVPEEFAPDEKAPLLLERFLKYEFDVKKGKKYYLCLADCGMGKTTFLINLFYRTLKQAKHPCKLVNLADKNCIDTIKDIKNQTDTILLLDALDENENALSNYQTFMQELEYETRNFFRVVITSRTNFFESGVNEQLSGSGKGGGRNEKFTKIQKFYITPFTDDDIKKYLKLRYPLNRKKQKQGWKLVDNNKNLAVRPMLLKFMDDLLEENTSFEYDFQLYEYLFQRWISRECKGQEEQNQLYQECLDIAKAIYYHWMKNGGIGITRDELSATNIMVPEIESIQLKGHALVNRNSDGVYKFSHKSYWEFLLAKLALSDAIFACDLLIQNFDRAVRFLEEMIQYYEKLEEMPDSAVSFGIANYCMKYKKLEETEQRYFRTISQCFDSGQKALWLLSMIQLAKCQWRLYKRKSAEETLKQCQSILDKLPFNSDTLYLYTQYGDVFATVCWSEGRKAAQKFLQRVIDDCIKNQMIGYDVLRCYTAYCYGCINYYLNQQMLNQMIHLIEQKFSKDLYAEYLLCLAKSYKTELGMSWELRRKLTEDYLRYADSYEKILRYSFRGISCAAASPEKWIEDGVNSFNKAYDLCCEIDKNTKYPPPNNAYFAAVVWCLIAAFSYTNSKKNELKNIDYILQYLEKKHLSEEAAQVHFQLINNYIVFDKLESFQKMEQAAFKQLNIAQAIQNERAMIEAYWSLYILYDSEDDQKELGQQYLKLAYEAANDSEEFFMTTSYCNLLQVVLDYYEGDLERSAIADELCEITPQIYGKDARRDRIYRALETYFKKMGDSRLIDTRLERLRCIFNDKMLSKFYDCCEAYRQTNRFFDGLEQVIEEKEVITQAEGDVLDEFLKYKRQQLDEQRVKELKALIRRKQFGDRFITALV